MSIFRSFSMHARVAALLLCIGGPAAWAAPAASYDPDALKLALAWEKIKFHDPKARDFADSVYSLVDGRIAALNS